MNSFQHPYRFAPAGNAAASREYDAQLGALVADVAAIAAGLAAAGRRVASLLTRPRTSAVGAAQ